MLRLKIEIDSNANLSYYPLFKYRCHLIVFQLFCILFSILSLILFSTGGTRPAWIVMVVISGLSIFLCLNDLGLHALEKAFTGPASAPDPQPQSPSPPYRAPSKRGRTSRPAYTDEVPVYEEVEGTLYPADASNNIDPDQRAPLLTPTASLTSETASETTADNHEHFRPSRVITGCDFLLACSQFILYLTTVILESVNQNRWGARTGYGLKMHAHLLAFICIFLHLRCFWLEVKALKSGHRDYFSFVIQRR